MNDKKPLSSRCTGSVQYKLARLMLVPLILCISLILIQNTAFAGDQGIVGPSMIQYDHNAKNLDNTIWYKGVGDN